MIIYLNNDIKLECERHIMCTDCMEDSEMSLTKLIDKDIEVLYTEGFKNNVHTFRGVEDLVELRRIFKYKGVNYLSIMKMKTLTNGKIDVMYHDIYVINEASKKKAS